MQLSHELPSDFSVAIQEQKGGLSPYEQLEIAHRLLKLMGIPYYITGTARIEDATVWSGLTIYPSTVIRNTNYSGSLELVADKAKGPLSYKVRGAEGLGLVKGLVSRFVVPDGLRSFDILHSYLEVHPAATPFVLGYDYVNGHPRTLVYLPPKRFSQAILADSDHRFLGLAFLPPQRVNEASDPLLRLQGEIGFLALSTNSSGS